MSTTERDPVEAAIDAYVIAMRELIEVMEARIGGGNLTLNAEAKRRLAAAGDLLTTLSQPQQPAPAQPVAWRFRVKGGTFEGGGEYGPSRWIYTDPPLPGDIPTRDDFDKDPLYLAAAAVQPPVVPLTEEE